LESLSSTSKLLVAQASKEMMMNPASTTPPVASLSFLQNPHQLMQRAHSKDKKEEKHHQARHHCDSQAHLLLFFSSLPSQICRDRQLLQKLLAKT
jgi:hypothetical protein